MNKKGGDEKSDNVFLVPDKLHGITYAVSVPKKTTEIEAGRIYNEVLIAANQYYKISIDVRRKNNIDLLKWINKFLELKKMESVIVEECG
jgi:hypothetical protein